LRRRKIADALVPALLSALITEVVLTMMFLFVIMARLRAPYQITARTDSLCGISGRPARSPPEPSLLSGNGDDAVEWWTKALLRRTHPPGPMRGFT
jgi:hypothetical protein